MLTAIEPFKIFEGFQMIIQADIVEEGKLFSQFQGLNMDSGADEIAENIVNFYYGTPFDTEFW